MVGNMQQVVILVSASGSAAAVQCSSGSFHSFSPFIYKEGKFVSVEAENVVLSSIANINSKREIKEQHILSENCQDSDSGSADDDNMDDELVVDANTPSKTKLEHTTFSDFETFGFDANPNEDATTFEGSNDHRQALAGRPVLVQQSKEEVFSPLADDADSMFDAIVTTHAAKVPEVVTTTHVNTKPGQLLVNTFKSGDKRKQILGAKRISSRISQRELNRKSTEDANIVQTDAAHLTDAEKEIAELKRQVSMMKKQLAMKDQDNIPSDSSTDIKENIVVQEQKKEAASNTPVEEFIEKNKDELTTQQKQLLRTCSSELQEKYLKMGRMLPLAAVVQKMTMDHPGFGNTSSSTVTGEPHKKQASPIDEFLEKHKVSLSDEEKKMFKFCTIELQEKYVKMGRMLPLAAVVQKMKMENPNIILQNTEQTDQASPIDEFLEKHKDSLSDEEKRMFKLCSPELQEKYKKMGRMLPVAAVVQKMKIENPDIILKGSSSKQKQGQPSLLDGMKNLKSVAKTENNQESSSSASGGVNPLFAGIANAKLKPVGQQRNRKSAPGSTSTGNPLMDEIMMKNRKLRPFSCRQMKELPSKEEPKTLQSELAATLLKGKSNNTDSSMSMDERMAKAKEEKKRQQQEQNVPAWARKNKNKDGQESSPSHKAIFSNHKHAQSAPNLLKDMRTKTSTTTTTFTSAPHSAKASESKINAKNALVELNKICEKNGTCNVNATVLKKFVEGMLPMADKKHLMREDSQQMQKLFKEFMQQAFPTEDSSSAQK